MKIKLFTHHKRRTIHNKTKTVVRTIILVFVVLYKLVYALSLSMPHSEN